MPGATTISIDSDPFSRRAGAQDDVTALVIAWSADEPHRVGECAFIPEDGREHVLGRGEEESDVRFFQQRPGTIAATPPLEGAGLSRRQLALTASDGTLAIERVGRCELRVNGVACDRATAAPGDTIQLRRQLVLACVRREPIIPPARHFPRDAWRPFGQPDAFGVLGESPATWRMREQIAFVAMAGTHALVLGASGSGKELAAHAIHALSKRAARPFVARNAATLPAGLIDAELFGNVKNYPNPGMPERAGLIGQADGGTLFLDELAELPEELQTHLLRVLDGGGEYHRLGEGAARRSSFVLVGATNRDASALKHDVLARLTSHVELTPLAARREDVPLLARHLLARAADKSPGVAARFLGRDAEGRSYARMEPALVEHLLRRDYATNTRELDAVLWRAMADSTGDVLVVPEKERAEPAARVPVAAPIATPAEEPSEDAIRAALSNAGGNVTQAAKQLGLSSRYALYRLMKKNGIDAPQ